MPEAVQGRAASLGPEGQAWLAELASVVAGLSEEWELDLGPTLEGGHEAFVARVTMGEGHPAVLKVGLPGSESGRQEARALAAAGGRGYAQVFRYDESRRAMLLEQLGPSLRDLEQSVNIQMRIICETLNTAWHRPAVVDGFANGAEKADSLAAFISETWEALGEPCSARVIERALTCLRRRRAAFAPETAVLAHGDAHASNTLLVPGSNPRTFKFIDPDGLFVEPAYDLSACMRDWAAPLLAGDALGLGRRRAELLASLTGVDPQAIWEWGFAERVSTGLYLQQLDRGAEAREFLEVAELWAMDSMP